MMGTKRQVMPRLGLGSAGIRMTTAEFDGCTRADDRFRYELIRGVLVVSRRPSISEVDPAELLGCLLRNFQADHPNGATLDFTLGERDIFLSDGRRRADRLIWAGLGRLPDIKVDVPTIAVEFVSKDKRDWLRDYVEKRQEYMDLGILEYWVIDRFRSEMTVYPRPPAEPAEQVIAAEGTYCTPILPGFELPLARLFAVANRWSKTRPEA